MIKKLVFNFILALIFIFILILTLLSTIGIKTDRFNELISNKINQTKYVNLTLKAINFKLDLKELSLFLETQQPNINYSDLSIPTKSIKVYVDFLALLSTNLEIKKININLDELDIVQLNKLSKFIKPSNFKSFLNNKIVEGKLISEIEIFFKDGIIKSYIVRGDVKNFKANFFSELSLSKTKFSFFADKEDILIKNIFGNIENIKIANGNVKLNLEDGIKLNSDFDTKINIEEKFLNKYNKLLNKYNLTYKIKSLNGNLSNNLSLYFDSTYKLKNYNYKFYGKIDKSRLELPYTIKNSFISDKINEIHFLNSKIESNFSPNNFIINCEGQYSFYDTNFLKFKFENEFNNNHLNLDLNFDFANSLDLDFINYKKPKNTPAQLSLKLTKKKNLINIPKLNFVEKNNVIKISDLKFKNNDFQSLKKIEVKTLNNDFFIQWGKKIFIKGKKFDATNLPKFFNEQNNTKKFNHINNNIEIDFKNIKAPVSEELQNFRLIGKIKDGKFIKISSKGDFGGDNYLDITMKKDQNSDKRYLEIYSDLTRPLLTEYNFFNGLSGGKLLFTSLIDESKSNSKLRIENFKIVNAPGVIKLLSLADLGGLADLAEGEGLSFDVLEIDMEKNKNFLKINEILALGPSISVLMEGYRDATGLTSLKGTLVPAKTLNKLISKIPVIGNIVIPKEVGEGLFGISFKMKGPKGQIKTSINPIRTITPRFIQKIIEKRKPS